MNRQIVHYFVEGKCEEKLFNAFKRSKNNVFIPGKISVFNVVNEKISKGRIMSLNKSTNIILVYDTDVQNTDTLEFNIALFKKYGYKVYHVQSLYNFEDELIYSTNLGNINEMFNTSSNNEFKSKFIAASDDGLINKLNYHKFDSCKIWSRKTKIPFDKYYSESGAKFIKQVK